MSVPISRIADALNLSHRQVERTVALLEEGATVPFIARYRKEHTGSLDEVQIQSIQQAHEQLKQLLKRRESILESIKSQDKLTPALRQKIEATWDAAQLEDLYLPYKQKRRTRATMARELGLEPLADWLWKQQGGDILAKAKGFVKEGVEDVEAALKGARDIIAERINEDQDARERVRRQFKRHAEVETRVLRGKKEEGAKYKDYFDFSKPLDKVQAHQFLAIQRAEREGVIRMKLEPEEEDCLYSLDRQFIREQNKNTGQLQEAIKDAYKRLLKPSISTEFKNKTKEVADDASIQIFEQNLRQLLLAAPLGQKRVLAIDPGYRTGCKVVCLNEQGDLLEDAVIYPHSPQLQKERAAQILIRLVKQFNIEAIAIGNGTASRETERFVRDLFNEKPAAFVVSEQGASIYSASEIAREEFPNDDVTVRGAVSIGRRLMDPLSELVKIDPKSIGVGQYQHDVNQKLLKDRLDTVVASCVNAVGVNVNTASKHLLTYVSGLGEQLAQNIIDHRSEQGPFQERKELLKVHRMGPKAFEQAAGFLRIPDAVHPLDATAVHPESYPIVEQMAKDLGGTVQDLLQRPDLRKKMDLNRYKSDTVGLPTLKDILAELEKPNRDPRPALQVFRFAEHIHSLEDLEAGMRLPGIVTNITAFGAFVDIGIKENGLVHKSQMARRFVKDPSEVLQLQQQLEVKVLEVDLKRKRIQLSLL